MSIPMDQQIAAKYHYELVLPLKRIELYNCVGNSTLRSMVANLALSAFHFAEHLQCPEPHNTTRHWKQQNSDYKLIGDIANACKHLHATRNNPEVVNSDDVYECLVMTQYFSGGESVYEDYAATVKAKKIDGTIVDVPTKLRSVINMWQSYLHGMGALDSFVELVDPFAVPLSKDQSRMKGIAKVVEVNEAPSIAMSDLKNTNIIVTKGVAAKLVVEMQAFDLDSGSVLPLPELPQVYWFSVSCENGVRV